MRMCRCASTRFSCPSLSVSHSRAPLKQRIAATDRLIDQIVYRLYGLTDEEIAIVESGT